MANKDKATGSFAAGMFALGQIIGNSISPTPYSAPMGNPVSDAVEQIAEAKKQKPDGPPKFVQTNSAKK